MSDPALGEFDALFDRVITPALAPLEAERQATLKTFWNRVRLGAVGGLGVAILFVFLSRDVDLEGVLATIFFVGLLAAGIAFVPVARFQKRCKTRALEDLAASLGMTYACDSFEPPAFERLQHLDLLPGGLSGKDFEDLFRGERAGAAFELYEARLTRGTGKNRRTVFRGQILKIAFPKAFLGVTVVNRESHRWSRPPGLQRVGLESSQFERIFEVFGDDQVEARFLVHPAFMEKLMALEASMRGKNLRCAFDDRHLLVAVEGGDQFEVVDVFKPLPDREKTRKGVEELAAVLGLIDAILSPPKNVWASPRDGRPE